MKLLTDKKNSVIEITRRMSTVSILIQFFICGLTIYFYAYSDDTDLKLFTLTNDSIFLFVVIKLCLFILMPTISFFVLLRKKSLLLFHKVTIKVLCLSITFGVMELLVAVILKLMLPIKTSENDDLSSLQFIDFVSTALQVFGEEMIFISAFLFFNRMLMRIVSEKLNIYASSILACMYFGLIHLSTYDYNVWQCVFLIGLTSLIQLALVLKTKNIWAGYIAHISYDFLAMLVITVLENN